MDTRPAPLDPTAYNALSALLSTDMQAVNDLILARTVTDTVPRIPAITKHLIEAGGKRLRPLLTLAGAHLCGYKGAHHIDLAATVEFIHTATLLHDDVVDKSQQRRGQPSVNVLWDNKSSVLVGDYFLAQAFQLMAETGSLQVLEILSKTAAIIVQGEIMQLSDAYDANLSESAYCDIIRCKTAALFAAAAQVGGVLAGADSRINTALQTYGNALGMGFQIVDDILDYSGHPATTGKNIGNDFYEGKITLPILKALQASNKEQFAFWHTIFAQSKRTQNDFAQAQHYITTTGAIDKARNDALKWSKRAQNALHDIPPSTMCDLLYTLASDVVNRVA